MSNSTKGKIKITIIFTSNEKMKDYFSSLTPKELVTEFYGGYNLREGATVEVQWAYPDCPDGRTAVITLILPSGERCERSFATQLQKISDCLAVTGWLYNFQAFKESTRTSWLPDISPDDLHY